MMPLDVIAAALFCWIGYEACAPKLMPLSYRTNIILLVSLLVVVNTDFFGAFIGVDVYHVHIASIVQGLLGGHLLRRLVIQQRLGKTLPLPAAR